ncbi:hypothetical protein A33M_3498 [Rhodovulum sp. PH10]|uniref:L,D-transpeptidase family protein n=1 Tax=Rhodovulum sp. PH10 TaxID=1187851 RepID=UPI00027C1F89|nr:L,D-transpeptidase family protein [Rhodovulum sp. PH10]EJW13514.1 hypothetical protein A33M_3498 [Rhodovulum sp. PH10]
MRFDRLLAGTALALVLTLGVAPARAEPGDAATVSTPVSTTTVSTGAVSTAVSTGPESTRGSTEGATEAVSSDPALSTEAAEPAAPKAAASEAVAPNTAAAPEAPAPKDPSSAAKAADEKTSVSVDDAVPPVQPAPVVVTPNDVAPADTKAAETAPSPTAPAAPATAETKAAPSAPATPDTAKTEPESKPAAPETAKTEPSPTAPATPDTAATTPAPAAPETAKTESAPSAPATPDTATPDTAATKPAPGTPAVAPETAKKSAPAAEPTTASIPEAVAPVQTLDQKVGPVLRDLLASKDRRFDTKTREALQSFYAARNDAPLWTADGVVSARAKAVAAQLRSAAADGLDPADYPVPQLAANPTPEDVAAYELALDAAVLDYAHHAAVGRVHWSRIAGDILYETKAPAADAVLDKLATADDARAALAGYLPQHPAYKALKAKLAALRGETADEDPPLADGPLMREGTEDERVPGLRKRLGVTGEGNLYDAALADAVKAFQKKHGLRPDGLVGRNTIEAINGPSDARTADIIVANLERWRWIDHDLGKAYVMVNIPDYTLKVYDHGAVKWKTRIVVGKPSKATPLLSETMKYITVNPTWNVPPSIVYNEYLPALQQDPTVLERMGLKVTYRRDGSVHVSQPPGAANALGRIRFNFPNKFLVYQHDTPDKYLFSKSRRAYSHGCMRVQDPDEYAEVLLSIALPKENYTAARIRKMYGSGETNINLPKPIPVHLTYQTAFVDEHGELQLRDDVYGRDKQVLAVLHGNERKVADVPVQRREASVRPRRQVFQAPPEPPRTSIFPFFNLFR